MWRFKENGLTVWQSFFLRLLSKRYTAAFLLLIIGTGAYLLVSVYTSSAFDGGSGTPDDPYIISTCAQLQEIDDQDPYLYASYILANDVDCSAVVSFETIGNYQSFDGNYRPFMGSFDGQGFTISNVTIGSPSTFFNGLFANLYGASVKNVTLDNFSVDGTTYLGALAGRVFSSSIVGVSVINSTITSHSNTGGSVGGLVGNANESSLYGIYVSSTTISSTGVDASSSLNGFGGIVGTLSTFTALDRSWASTTITANMSGVGGLVGEIVYGAIIMNSYSEGTIVATQDVGGIVGGFNSTFGTDTYINSVYSNMSLTATSPTGRVGGINGGFTCCSTAVLHIADSFAVGYISSTTNSGGISGISFSPTSRLRNNVYYPTGTGQTRCAPTGVYSAGECTSNNSSAYFNSSANAPLSSWDFTNTWSEEVSARPTLQLFPFTPPSTAISISTCADLAANVKADPAGWYELSGNIDCANDTSLVPLNGNTATSSGFFGILDGQGFQVAGVGTSRSASRQDLYGLGLFGRMYGATARNLTLSGAGVTALTIQVGKVGALAGAGVGVVIENVTSSVPVTTGADYGGGLVGYGSGNFNNVAVTANIDAVELDPFWLGGIIGYADVLLMDRATYSGTISSYWYTGGIAGEADLAQITNATTTGTIIGNVRIGGIFGIVGGGGVAPYSSLNNTHSTVTITPDSPVDNYYETIGGIVGLSEHVNISNSSFSGTLSVPDPNGAYVYIVGGLAGYLGGNTLSSTSTISNSFVNAFITIQGGNSIDPYIDSVGGMVGQAENLEIYNSVASTTMRFGDEPSTNYINTFYNIGGLIGTNYGPLYFNDVVTEGSITIFEDVSGGSGGYGYGLGGFAGYIDRTVIENATSSVDIFIKTYQPGAISNFIGDFQDSTVTNANVTGSLYLDAAENPYYIGGLAGFAYGLTVASSSVSGDISIVNSLWPYDIGGLIGFLDNFSTIQQTYTNNDIVIESGTDGLSQGPYAVGGFIGRIVNDIILRDTYASTTISITSSALNQPTAGGNIGGYIGYIGFINNSITNSYAAGSISIVSDISAVFQRVGGFIGWSASGTNTYTNNFTVTSIAPIASSTNVGAFIGQYTGTSTFANNYYDQTRTQQSVCSGIDAIDPAWCNAQNIAAAEPTYFFDATNPPLSTWDFTNIWLEHPDTYPTFGVSAPMGSTPPTVTTTDPATSIAQTSATIAGNITSLGSGTVTARGFVYGLTPLLGATTTANSAGFSTGSFNTGLTGLVCNTTYYFAAYASGNDGSDYGATESFTTAACPVVSTPPTVSTTASASAITQTSATLTGNISSLGSATITTRGFAYGLTTALGATTTENSTGFSTGGYTAGITSLTCNTTYYFRAYASGNDGTGYGTTQNFTTTACATPPPASTGGTSGTRVKPKSDTTTNVLKKTDSITICHQTGSEKYVSNTNVQVFIDLAESGYIATLRGHDGHAGDIVPLFTYDLGEGIKTYEGNNWSQSNKILHANDCELFLKPDLPPKQPPAPVPTPSTPAPPAPEPQDVSVPSCDTRSVYTQVSSPLPDGVTIKTTVPAGAVKSKKVESNGKANYALEFKVKPLNETKSESYIEKFTDILVKYQENTNNENVPFGIEKKLKAIPYTPPTPAVTTEVNLTTATTLVRVESAPPCEVTTVSESVITEQTPAAPPAQVPPTQTEEQLTIVSDILQLVDVLEWDLTNVTTPIPPFEVSVIDELGNAVTQFDEPVIMEITHPSILGSEQSIQVMQPSADGTTWYEVPFEVDGDTIRITIQNPGEFFIWFLPRTASASDEAAASPSGLMPWLTIEFPRWLLGIASSVGLGAGLGMLLLQLSRMPVALEHLSRNVSAGLNNLIGLLTFRKKRRPWGTVYDSVTKAPVDPAYVELFDESGNKKGEAFTDLDGRYGFLVPEGSYSMMVRKTNYTFPSKMIHVTGQDVIYHNLYFGGTFNVSDTVVHDVPMDPQGYDWNQHEKMRTNQTRFFHRLDPLFVRLLDILFYLGFIAMVWQFSTSVSGTTGALLALYTVLLIGRFVSGKPVLYGTVSKAGQPLSYGVLRVLQDDTEILTKVIDAYGRYIALVPNGTYTMVIEEHVIDDQYRVVYERRVKATHGVINARIRVS